MNNRPANSIISDSRVQAGPGDFPLLACFLGIVWLLGGALSAWAAEREVLAHGSSQMYWIARVEQTPQGSFQTIIQSRPIGGDGRWRRIAQLPARVVSMTGRGTQLAALLESGDWMLLWEGGSSTGPRPEDGARLVLLAGGDEQLWAMAWAPNSATQPPSAGTSGPANMAPAVAGPSPVASQPGAGALRLYRLEQGNWVVRGPLPAEAQSARLLRLTVVNRAPMLAVWAGSAAVPVFRWNEQAQGWESAGQVNCGSGVARMDLLNDRDRPLLWISESNGALVSDAIFTSDGGTSWSGPIALALPHERAGDWADVASASQPRVATVAGGSLRVLVLPATGSGKLVELTYLTNGGFRDRLEIPSPAGQPEGRNFEWFSAIAVAMVMLVLLTSLRQRGGVTARRPRRGSARLPQLDDSDEEDARGHGAVAPKEALAAAGWRLAPQGLRLLAGTIDAVPVIGTILIAAMKVEPADVAADYESIRQQMQVPFQIAIAIYIFYTGFAELVWGWTIGKRLCGLRVVRLDGSPPGAGALAVRNLLRLVDALLLFPLVLVLISPLRQRFGDVAAETVVVAPAPATGEQSKTADTHHAAGDAPDRSDKHD
ncbi:RDD family protein [Fontivita pretiosa]|uniref:RDD family protein n=1 Tax=Fontivita pretiosa TaxID=2989684 RepID=UPI003D17BD15